MRVPDIVSQQNATQPVEAPGAGTATQPVEAPSVGLEVLLTGTGNAALQSDSEEDLQRELSSHMDDNQRCEVFHGLEQDP